MPTFIENLDSTVVMIATDIVELRNRSGQLINLSTTNKTNLVSAINELKTLLDTIDVQGLIDDTAISGTTKTYSIDKIKDTIQQAINALVDGAPLALDTLNELAAALTSNDSELATLTVALDNRVSYGVQTKTITEKTQARNNIDAVGVGEDISETNVNLDVAYPNVGTILNNKQALFNSKVDTFVGNVGDTTVDLLAYYNTAAGN